MSNSAKPLQVRYQLHASQLQAFRDPARFIVVVAGRRFGKTILALTKLITLALHDAGSLVWFVAPTYRQAEMIAWRMLLHLLPRPLIKKSNDVKLELELVNGSEIHLKGSDNEDALRGVGLAYVVMDEYGLMKPNVWPEIIRPMLTDRQGGALFIGTPRGKNHFWELWLRGQRQEPGWASYQFPTAANPYLPPAEIATAKTQLSDRYFRQEYEAGFEDFTGLVWPEFDSRHHVIDAATYRPETVIEHVGAIDTALSGTTAALLGAVDANGDLTIVREFYAQDQRVSEVVHAIQSWTPAYWVIDPAAKICNVQRNGMLYSLYDEFAEHGILAHPAQHEVWGGINRVAELFKQHQLRVVSTCTNLIHELERYHWAAERETGLGVSTPKPYKAHDHACDALRYLVMSRPAVPVPAHAITPGSAEDWERRQEEQTAWTEYLTMVAG